MKTGDQQATSHEFIFAVRDPRHQIIRLECRTWDEHITVHHPEIAATTESTLRKLISAPTRITNTADKNAAIFEDGSLQGGGAV